MRGVSGTGARPPAVPHQNTKQAVELATLQWVHWFNHHRLLEPMGNLPPAEAEDAYHSQFAESAISA